jgi:hypothetical protein
MENKHIKLFDEYRYFNIDKSIPPVKDENESFLNINKCNYKQNKQNKRFEEQRIEQNKELERLKRESPLLIKYLDMLNDLNSISKYYVKGNNKSILLKNGDKLEIERVRWDQGDEYFLKINGRIIPGSYSDDDYVCSNYTIELKNLIERVIEIIDTKREQKKWKDFE